MMKMIHSGWAYLIVAFLVFAVIRFLMNKNKKFTDADFRVALFTLILSHIQLIIGLGWYFMSPYWKTIKANGMGEVMKDSNLRLLTVEHPLMMIIAIVLITIGFSKHKKKTTDIEKFKTLGIFYTIALIFVLVRIPWNQWLA